MGTQAARPMMYKGLKAFFSKKSCESRNQSFQIVIIFKMEPELGSHLLDFELGKGHFVHFRIKIINDILTKLEFDTIRQKYVVKIVLPNDIMPMVSQNIHNSKTIQERPEHLS